MQNSAVNIIKQELLSDNWYILKKITFERVARNGSAQRQAREVYDRGNGATILLYDPVRRTVVLTRQFRLPAFMNSHSGYLIETQPACSTMPARKSASASKPKKKPGTGSARWNRYSKRS